jgi:hypothetical protein
MLEELTAGLPHQEAWRLVAALTQRLIENLRDGAPNGVDIAAARAAWNGQRLEAVSAEGGTARRKAPRRRLRSVP